MQKINNSFLILMISLVLGLGSCKKEDDPRMNFDFGPGLFIANEGIFQSGTGTVTFYDFATGTTTQDVFKKANNRDLGNVLQSICIHDSTAYLVVNNAAKIEVVNARTFRSIGVITGVTKPRYFLVINSQKAYVSDWAGVVDIVDLTTNTVTGTIPAGNGPETMMKSGNNVFVVNCGGFTADSTVTIINSTTDQVIRTLNVNYRPTGIVEDAAGKIWVNCSGKGYNGYPDQGDTRGYLMRFNANTYEFEFSSSHMSTSIHPEKLVINNTKDWVYYLREDGIYKYKTDMSTFGPIKVVSHSNLYALGYDATRNYLMATNPLDYKQDGWVIRYQADNGVLVDSIPAGFIPGSITIKE
jgi:hypothetical protein